jgi:hypothetical protein
MYFHDKGTNRRVMLMGLVFCTGFVLFSFFAKPQPENDRVLVKADDLDGGKASAGELSATGRTPGHRRMPLFDLPRERALG